jgi:serine/threonine-protein kinase RsbW
MRTHSLKASETSIFSCIYPGDAPEVRNVRADLASVLGGCPVADDLILVASELASNAVLHSLSGNPGGQFIVRAIVDPGDCVRIEVVDLGGEWAERHDDERGHGRGLEIVAKLAGGGNWGIQSGPASRTVWARLAWTDPR